MLSGGPLVVAGTIEHHVSTAMKVLIAARG